MQLIESLGNQTVEKLLWSLAKFERCDNVQAALKFNLLMMLQTQFQQSPLLAQNAKSQIQNYISSSRLLDLPIIQCTNFDMSQLFESVVNSKSGQNKKVPHTKVIKQQQIDLIVYIVQICFLKAFPCKSYEDCYQNSLTIGESWEPIIEVFSRIKYYELLCTKQLKADFRKLVEQRTPPCSAQEYK